MPFILTSCLNYYQEVKLAIDGSGSMHIDYWMLLPDDESASVVSKIGIFTPDSIKKEFTSEHSIVENRAWYGTHRSAVDMNAMGKTADSAAGNHIIIPAVNQ